MPLTPEEIKKLTKLPAQIETEIEKGSSDVKSVSTAPFPTISTTKKPEEYSDKDISELQKKIQVKRLEKELASIEAPNTNMDMFKTILEMQNNNFTQLMQMQNQRHEIDLKLAKLENGDGGNDFIGDLLPLLPELIKMRQQQTNPQAPPNLELPKKGKKEEKTQMQRRKPTKKQLEEYKQKIKAGEVTVQQFISDVRSYYPQYSQFNDEVIASEYNKIKNES